MLAIVYFPRNDRGSLFSLATRRLFAFLPRSFFSSFAYRVGCNHLHSSVSRTTCSRNPQLLSTDCDNLFLSIPAFSLPSSLHFVFLAPCCSFFAPLLEFFFSPFVKVPRSAVGCLPVVLRTLLSLVFPQNLIFQSSNLYFPLLPRSFHRQRLSLLFRLIHFRFVSFSLSSFSFLFLFYSFFVFRSL